MNRPGSKQSSQDLIRIPAIKSALSTLIYLILLHFEDIPQPFINSFSTDFHCRFSLRNFQTSNQLILCNVCKFYICPSLYRNPHLEPPSWGIYLKLFLHTRHFYTHFKKVVRFSCLYSAKKHFGNLLILNS